MSHVPRLKRQRLLAVRASGFRRGVCFRPCAHATVEQRTVPARRGYFLPHRYSNPSCVGWCYSRRCTNSTWRMKPSDAFCCCLITTRHLLPLRPRQSRNNQTLQLNLESTWSTYLAYVSGAAMPLRLYACSVRDARLLLSGVGVLASAVLFHRHGRSASVVEAGEWYLMEDSWGTSTERTKMRMQSRRRGGDALAIAVKALLATAGNPSVLSGTRIPSTRAIAPDDQSRGAIGSVDGRAVRGAYGGEGHEDIFRNWADAPTVSQRAHEIPDHERFHIYRKLPQHTVHDEM